MKKILTLFVMLFATAGILSAQTLSYQAVVRNHDAENNQDTLVHDTEINLEVNVYNGPATTPVVYQEIHKNVLTSPNGLVSILIGTGIDQYQSMTFVDWSNATISVDFKFADGTPIGTSQMKVQPVPYAIQAGGGNLTTEQIANYVRDVLTYDQAAEIWHAIVNNPNNLKNGIKDTVIKYMKAHKDIAKEVAEAYFDYLDANNVQEVYTALSGNTGVKSQIKQTIINYIKAHPEIAKDIVLYYLQNATTEDVNNAYAVLQSMPTATKQALKNRIVDYVKSNRALASQVVLFFINNTTTTEASLTIQYLRNNNQAVWNQMRDTLNVYIDYYMQHLYQTGTNPEAIDENDIDALLNQSLNDHNFLSDSTCPGVDLCDLSRRIDSLDEISQETEPDQTCVDFGDGYAEVTPNGLFIQANIMLPTGLSQYPQVRFLIYKSSNTIDDNSNELGQHQNGQSNLVLVIPDTILDASYTTGYDKVYAMMNASEVEDKLEPSDYKVAILLSEAEACTTPLPEFTFTIEATNNCPEFSNTRSINDNGFQMLSDINLDNEDYENDVHFVVKIGEDSMDYEAGYDNLLFYSNVYDDPSLEGWVGQTLTFYPVVNVNCDPNSNDPVTIIGPSATYTFPPACPSFGEDPVSFTMQSNGFYTLKSPIENFNSASFGTNNYFYVQDVLDANMNFNLTAQFSDDGKYLVATFDPANVMMSSETLNVVGRTVRAKPYATPAGDCLSDQMLTGVPGTAEICTPNTNKPSFAYVGNTSGEAKLELFPNKGVILSAKIANYISEYENLIQKNGFLISSEPIETYNADKAVEVQRSGSTNDSLIYTVGFDHCGETLYYRPFMLISGCDSLVLGEQKSFTMWAPQFTVSAEPTFVGSNQVLDLNAVASMTVGTFCNATHSMEEWISLDWVDTSTCTVIIDGTPYQLNTMKSFIESVMINTYQITADNWKYIWEVNGNQFFESSTTGHTTTQIPQQNTTYTAKGVFTYDNMQCVVKGDVTITIQ